MDLDKTEETLRAEITSHQNLSKPHFKEAYEFADELVDLEVRRLYLLAVRAGLDNTKMADEKMAQQLKKMREATNEIDAQLLVAGDFVKKMVHKIMKGRVKEIIKQHS
jgi:hypothetical protein